MGILPLLRQAPGNPRLNVRAVYRAPLPTRRAARFYPVKVLRAG